ncbi:AraC family transcriptional regulator [Pandoraea terrae]|uniref:AraC family transcriptional regulator n=1 Tax=Pandoraea terrae TaxID=1537710 RepID=A0A5E4VIR3_9BURK|nr:AraC family transcriptional regulator [Pandoraea terrae]VVE12167.1 AraC family transcriptional regulator [Pandoraea terrae]
MNPLSATVPISLVNGFLAGADPAAIERLAGQSGIPHELLRESGARVTQEQFSTLYRLLASELDDEMPGIFSRPLRNGTLKYLCLSLLDAPRLEVAIHRFGQFFHLILDEFRFESQREGAACRIELVAKADGPPLSVLGRELMLKLVHGVASWLIGQRIPLLEVEFDFPRPPQASDYLYLFPGPVRFDCARTFISFEVKYLDMAIRQRKSDLKIFLSRAPEDWIFVSFAEQMVCHRVRQYIADCLPTVPTIEAVAREMHYSVRTLCRRLSAEGTTFQAIKDELRRDIAIQRLTRSADAIGTIAYDVGFDDPTAFHRAFRHWTGSTPQAYRKMA